MHVDVLSMWLTEYIPVCDLKTALQCLVGLLRPHLYSPRGLRLPSHQGHVAGTQVYQVVVRSSQGRQGEDLFASFVAMKTAAAETSALVYLTANRQ